MSERPQLTWSCPGCGRRVPLRVERCHCGRPRETARALPEAPRPLPFRPSDRWSLTLWRTMPLDVKALVVVAILLVTGGIGWSLFGPQSAERMPALLGYKDPTPPPPTPPPPTRPPFKLPWWR
jgi:hypothetical protein